MGVPQLLALGLVAQELDLGPRVGVLAQMRLDGAHVLVHEPAHAVANLDDVGGQGEIDGHGGPPRWKSVPYRLGTTRRKTGSAVVWYEWRCVGSGTGLLPDDRRRGRGVLARRADFRQRRAWGGGGAT